MRAIGGVFRNYDWGSREAIARLQGRLVPSEEPEAELWFGSHPTAPSPLPDGRGLDEEHQLPFLVKILAAAQPLSLQAHPDAERAREGFDRESELTASAPVIAGVAGAALAQELSRRNYVDPNPKPEMLVALTEFSALCGFRKPALAAQAIASLQVPQLTWLVEELNGPVAEEALASAVTQLLDLDRSDCAVYIEQALKAVEHAGDGHMFADAHAVLRQLSQYYPDDPGVFVALLLEHVVLQPGEGLFMPTGHMHAYLSGMGVEIMAASDNVLRGGLTNKHVDVPELLRVVKFTPIGDPRRAPSGSNSSASVRHWPVETDEFRVVQARLHSGERDQTTGVEESFSPTGPRIVLCVKGQVTVSDAEGSAQLSPGQAAFSGPAGGTITAFGDGEVFLISQ
ncbi:mannose-6-phosphate isomerase, class I [Natronoglycomyces albus]|uniref:mannose-6-phosphate isomerase n=1 Tax=Natronoglycomyces albus TaxID=2811108 RepID=A0A895XTP7_9ACTN|nr:mannose-6-phosphate isomerase, class I [Natronoglycomyces albus]QSB05896.1 mannose-6-phosphate isomerase, class I [Natronoglycomyces albus]